MVEKFISNQSKIKIKVNEITFIVDKNYKIIEKLGKGAYGHVVKAKDLSEEGEDEELQYCAIKKIDEIFEHAIFAKRCLRELKILRLLEHENIVCIKEVMIPETKDFTSIYVVYDLMETDLGDVIKSDQPLDEKHIKYFMHQLLKGMKHMHDVNIIHRDLKPKNLLVNADCIVKICDFGLSRPLFTGSKEKKSKLTDYIATRWYRPPEVLLEWDTYDKSLDVWSIGCIFAELLDRKPLFPGKESAEQIELILSILGTPKIEDIYKEGRSNSRELIFKYGKIEKVPWKEIIPNGSEDALDLLEKMLKFDPDKRITVDKALKHKYFDDLPYEEEDKPEPVSKFDFEFEEKDLSTEDLRELILHEIMLYHDQKLLDEYEKDKEIYKKNLKMEKKLGSISKNASKSSITSSDPKKKSSIPNNTGSNNSNNKKSSTKK